MAVRSLPEYKSKYDKYIYVDDADSFLIDLEQKTKYDGCLIAIDTETYYNPEYKNAIIRYIKGTPNNVPFGVSIYDGEYGYWIDHDMEKLKLLLECPTVELIMHNSKYDLHMFKNIGIDVKARIWDTMIMIHLIDEEFECKMPGGGTKKSKKLKDLAYHFLGEDAHELEYLVDEYRDIIARNSGRGKNSVSFKEVSDTNKDLMKDYACADTEFTFRLFKIFKEELLNQRLIQAYEVDLGATLETLEIERTGVKTDIEYLTTLHNSLSKDMKDYERQAYNIAGKEFNLNSANELVEAFESLGISWEWFTDKDEYKTDDGILRMLLKQYEGSPVGELVSVILKYRDANKVRDTFVSGLIELTQADGRVHPNFNVCPRPEDNQGGTRTGRLSSSDPNFQNLPKNDKRVRKGIVPEDGFIFVEMDADQQEYRLMAHYAGDRNFMQFVHEGKDVHGATGSMMFKTEYGVLMEECRKKDAGEEYNKEIVGYRDKGKRINFGLIYGLGLAALAKSIGMDIDEPLYKKAGWLIRAKGIKPWELPSTEELLKMFPDEKDKEAIKYYMSNEATHIIQQVKELKSLYFSQFPDIEKFIKDVINVTKRRGWVKTWTGRRRHFHDPKNEAYKAPNALIQGGCGDIIKVKMRECGVWLRRNGKKSRIVNNIHDAILFEIHKSELDVIPVLNAILSDLSFNVPITWGIEYSTTSWADLKKATYEEIIKEVGQYVRQGIPKVVEET